jgi:hypothetical protein
MFLTAVNGKTEKPHKAEEDDSADEAEDAPGAASISSDI